MKMNKYALFALVILLTNVSAVVELVSPVDVKVEPLAEVPIRPVGPGHEVVLKFQREVEKDIFMDSIELTSPVDDDWEINLSSDSEYLYYSIRVPPDKPAIMQPFKLTLMDSTGLKNVEEVEVKLYVTRNPDDLINITGFKENPSLYADEEGYATLHIINKALSVAEYQIDATVEGVSSAGGTYTTTLQPAENKQVKIPLKISTERVYTLNARIWSRDNPSINETVSTRVYVRPTFKSKFKNIGQGFPMIPLTLAPFYAVLGLLGF